MTPRSKTAAAKDAAALAPCWAMFIPIALSRMLGFARFSHPCSSGPAGQQGLRNQQGLIGAVGNLAQGAEALLSLARQQGQLIDGVGRAAW